MLLFPFNFLFFISKLHNIPKYKITSRVLDMIRLCGLDNDKHKQIGEFVAPNSPQVVTLVQVDRLLAHFTLMDSQASLLELGQVVPIAIGNDYTKGTVKFISPVTNAESGTVLVRLCVDNSRGQFRSGQRCRMQLRE